MFLHLNRHLLQTIKARLVTFYALVVDLFNPLHISFVHLSAHPDPDPARTLLIWQLTIEDVLPPFGPSFISPLFMCSALINHCGLLDLFRHFETTLLLGAGKWDCSFLFFEDRALISLESILGVFVCLLDVLPIIVQLGISALFVQPFGKELFVPHHQWVVLSIRLNLPPKSRTRPRLHRATKRLGLRTHTPLRDWVIANCRVLSAIAAEGLRESAHRRRRLFDLEGICQAPIFVLSGYICCLIKLLADVDAGCPMGYLLLPHSQRSCWIPRGARSHVFFRALSTSVTPLRYIPRLLLLSNSCYYSCNIWLL